MAVYDQPKTTYSDTTNAVRVISNVINLIDPMDTPLLSALGGLDAGSTKLKIRGNGTMIEWLEDAYQPLSDVAAQGTTITTNTTVLTVTDASIFKKGHVIQIDAEYMVVATTDTTNNTLSVYSRSYGGTNATHVTTSTVSIVGMARVEGSDADFDNIVDITAPYNYTAIFQHGLKITGTEMVVDEYGYSDVWAYQANKAMPSQFRLIEAALFNGVRAAGTATTPRSFGGLGTFITTNTVAAGGAIAKTHLDSLAEKIKLTGGNPDLLVLHPSVANDLRALLDTSSFVKLTQENNAFGMRAITQVNTQYGPLTMLEDRWCPLAKAWMLDSSKVGLYTLRPFGWNEIARVGDARRAELIGEISLAVANDAAHGWISGITS